MEFNHKTVLLDEAIQYLEVKPEGIYVDGTLGGGGHSLEIVKKLKNGKLIGIDQDMAAIEKAKQTLKDFKHNIIFTKENFRNIRKILFKLNIESINGLVLDLGVSSYQLDEGERGFSYNKNAKLDMRMDKNNKLSAWEVVNRYSREEITRVIKDYGEERWAARISEFIVNERGSKNIDTTFDLVEVIKKAIPAKARKKEGHPGRKTFQGIRIEVNNELGIIKETIKDTFKILEKKGRVCIITFHSLEDRIVKETFKELETDCICPPKMPICNCNKKREAKIITKKPILPREEEIKENPRARSAKLRVAEKV